MAAYKNENEELSDCYGEDWTLAFMYSGERFWETVTMTDKIKQQTFIYQ